MYINTSTGYVYQCTIAGNASTAKWVYKGSIRGAAGIQGPKGDTGPAGATGEQGVVGNISVVYELILLTNYDNYELKNIQSLITKKWAYNVNDLVINGINGFVFKVINNDTLTKKATVQYLYTTNPIPLKLKYYMTPNSGATLNTYLATINDDNNYNDLLQVVKELIYQCYEKTTICLTTEYIEIFINNNGMEQKYVCYSRDEEEVYFVCPTAKKKFSILYDKSNSRNHTFSGLSNL